MGLKDKILDAKRRAANETNMPLLDISKGSYLEKEAEYIADAIIETLTEANFTITQLKAPVVVESLKTPAQPVNIELEIEKAVTPLLEGGAKLAGLDLGKDAGGLESIGYVYIGEDPESIDGFDVGDEDGQRQNTNVKLIIDDGEELK